MPQDDGLLVPQKLYSRQITDYLKNSNSPFDEVLTAQRSNILQINGCYEPSMLRDEMETANTGEVISQPSEFELRHNAAGDMASLLSAARGIYEPGAAGEMGIGVRISGELTDDAVAEWGYLEYELGNPSVIKNGAVFGKDSNGIYVKVYRESQVRIKKYREEWNMDKDSPEIDVTNVEVYQIRFTYYGGGLLEFRIRRGETGDPEQDFRTIHTYKPAGETTFQNSNLKVGGYAKSNNSSNQFSLFISGRQYSIIGLPRYKQRTISHNVEDVTVPTTDFVPLMSFQRDPTRRGVAIGLQEFQAVTDNDILIGWKINATLSGTLSWITPSFHLTEEVAIQVDESATGIDMSTGALVDLNIVQGGAGAEKNQFAEGEIVSDVPDTYVISLVAKAKDTEATVDAIGKMIEYR